MATTDNANLVRAIYDAFNAKDLEKLRSCLDAGGQATNVALGAKGGLFEDFEDWARAFPDGRIEVKTVIVQGDHGFAEIVGHGTHTGTLKGGPTGDLPATGRRIDLPVAEVFQFRDGKAVELRYYFDAFTFFRQLGIGAPEAGAEQRGEPASSH